MRRGTLLLTLLLAAALLAGCGRYCVSERVAADGPVAFGTIIAAPDGRGDGHTVLRLVLPAGWDEATGDDPDAEGRP